MPTTNANQHPHRRRAWLAGAVLAACLGGCGDPYAHKLPADGRLGAGEAEKIARALTGPDQERFQRWAHRMLRQEHYGGEPSAGTVQHALRNQTEFELQQQQAQAEAAARQAQAEEQARQQAQAQREQQAAEAARVELAKAQLRLEAQAEKVAAQALEIERLASGLKAAEKARQEAQQSAAVLSARLEAADARARPTRRRPGGRWTAWAPAAHRAHGRRWSACPSSGGCWP